jgi:tetratricopeptide (TPR) repeat protein
MSRRFLDPDDRLPADARGAVDRAFALMNNAEYQETFNALKGLVPHDDALTRGMAYLYLGDLYHFQWEFQLSAQGYRRALEEFGAAGSRRGLTMTKYRIADTLIDEADSTDVPADRKAQARAEGDRLLAEALEEAEQLDEEFLRAFGKHFQALFATEEGDFVAAAAFAQQAIAIRERIGDTEYGPSSTALLARAKAELGDFEGAVELAESTYRTQMERGLRGAALRTLTIISYINEIWHTQRSSALTSQFTAVEPIARTPFLLGEHSEAELAVAAPAASDETPLMAAQDSLSGMRRKLVADSRLNVMLLSS